MKRLKWWFRGVGIIYLLLGTGFVPFLNEMRLSMMLPGFDAPAGGVAYRGFLDFSFMFGLDLIVIGAFLIYASREPLKNSNLVWLVILLELIRGIFDDVYMIAEGYNVPVYSIFILLHLLIITTGIANLRKTKSMQSQPLEIATAD